MPHSILDAIGNTPMVEINKLNPNPKVKLLAKLEHFNPGGSVKDRAALYMIAAAEKSAGLTMVDLMNMGYSGRVIRFWLSSSHYRKPIPFSKERLDNAQRAIGRLDKCVSNLRSVKQGQSYAELEQLLYDLKNGFNSAMDDDLNISAALATVFTIVKKINTLILKKQLQPKDASKIVDGFRSIDAVLHIFNFFDHYSDPEIQRLFDQRDKARLEKNWVLADKIRDELRLRGILVQDQN